MFLVEGEGRKEEGDGRRGVKRKMLRGGKDVYMEKDE